MVTKKAKYYTLKYSLGIKKTKKLREVYKFEKHVF